MATIDLRDIEKDIIDQHVGAQVFPGLTLEVCGVHLIAQTNSEDPRQRKALLARVFGWYTWIGRTPVPVATDVEEEAQP